MMLREYIRQVLLESMQHARGTEQFHSNPQRMGDAFGGRNISGVIKWSPSTRECFYQMNIDGQQVQGDLQDIRGPDKEDYGPLSNAISDKHNLRSNRLTEPFVHRHWIDGDIRIFFI